MEGTEKSTITLNSDHITNHVIHEAVMIITMSMILFTSNFGRKTDIKSNFLRCLKRRGGGEERWGTHDYTYDSS